jgi:hypothetical protein
MAWIFQKGGDNGEERFAGSRHQYVEGISFKRGFHH